MLHFRNDREKREVQTIRMELVYRARRLATIGDSGLRAKLGAGKTTNGLCLEKRRDCGTRPSCFFFSDAVRRFTVAELGAFSPFEGLFALEAILLGAHLGGGFPHGERVGVCRL